MADKKKPKKKKKFDPAASMYAPSRKLETNKKGEVIGSKSFKKPKDSPMNMKKQGYNARLDDSLGSKNGKKSQSMKDRRDESEGMEESKGKRKYSGNKSSDSPMNMSGKAYDNKEAYNKDLSASARLHYLENERHDDNSPAKMYGKKGSPAHMSRDLSYGGPVIDQEPKALSHMGASKVLKHMKSK